MLSAPGNAFAENEAVSKDVNEIINRLMAPDDNSTGAKKLENEELAKIRSKLLSEIKGLQKTYKENMEGIENYQKQIEELQKKVGEVEKELNGFEKTAIIGGALAIIGTVGLAIGTGGVGLVIVGVATAVGAIAAEHYAEDPDSLRRLINGSYTWSTQQLISNTKTIDASSITNVEAKDEKQKQALQKALSVVQEYNAVAQQLHKLGESALSTAQQLDQKVEELNSMQTTIKAGQSLYKYTIMGKTKDGKPTILAEYYFIMEGDKFQSITGVTRGCVPLPAKLAESRSCIYCPLFKTIFNAAQSMSTKAYDKLAGPLANVMLIGFAIVIAFMVLKNVSSFTKQDAPKFVTELLVNMFKVLVAYYMLKNANIVYGYIVGPVLKAGFEFGSSLLFAKNDSYLAACDVSKTLQNVSNGVMPAYLYTNLDCFIRAVQAEVAVPQSVGSSLMCVARNAGKESIGPVRNVLWDFGMMFQGFAIWVMGWIISLAFAFYLIDATIQLGIIGALMPFLIACWPFKATRNYTSKGWGIFMNTFFVYVFMGLVVSINVELLGQGLTGSKGGFDAIMKALNGNNVQELKELLDIGFAGFLVLVACCLFAFKLTGQASDLAGTMAGGGGPKIGANIGGLAYGAATKGVQGTLKTGLGAAKAVSDKTGLTNVVNKGRDWAKDKVWGAVGLGRRSGAAGNKQARRSQMGDQQQQQSSTDGQTPQTQTRPATPGAPNPTAQNQIKKMQQAGPRSQQPATPSPQTPTNPSTPQGGAAQGGAAQGGTPHGNQADAQQTQTPQQTPEQMRQQLESDYNNTANGRAGRQMIQNQTAEVARNKKAENEAQGKMNYHNRRADDYLKKAQSASDPAQKKNFENLANAQFEEAVKAEAAYNKAKADTQKAQSELDAIKQENERYKNQYVQDEMKKRNPKK